MPANRAQQTLTADRRRKAVELKIAGHTWQQIADALGYSSKGAACTDVRRALEKAVSKLSIPLEAHRQIVLDRIEAMQKALWPAVQMGDTKAIDASVRLLDRYCKVLGLDAPQRHELTLEAIDAALADVEQQLAAARGEAAEAEGAPEEEG